MGFGITKEQRRMIVVLLSGTLLAVLNMTLLTPALPTIMTDMEVSAATVQWLTSGYALVEAVVIPLSAYMIGRFSTRKLFMGGILVFATGSFVAAMAQAFWMLLAGRMMQAAATGVLMPMVSSIVLLVFPREKRGSAMGIIGLIIGFAPAVGPSLSGVIVDHVGWRALFLMVTALALIVVVAAFKELVNFENFKRSKFDGWSVLLSTAGLVSLLYGFSTLSTTQNALVTAGLIVLGIVLVLLYAKRQLSLDEPMLRLDILRTRQYRTVVIIIALFQAALIGMETVMPLYIQGVLGHSATVSGLTLLPGPVIGAIVGLLAGRLFDRFGVRRPVLFGSAFLFIAAVGLALLGVDSAVPSVSLAYALVAIGVQFTMTPLNTWGVNSLANEKVSHAQSTSNTVNQVAGSFGTAILVSAAAIASNSATMLEGVERTFAGYHVSFMGAGTLLVIAMIAILVFVRDGKKGRAEERIEASKSVSCARVEDAMNPVTAHVAEDATMREVIELMAETGTSGVAVVNKDGFLTGFVSDGDVARYLGRSDLGFASAAGNLIAHYRDDDDLRARLKELSELNVMRIAVTSVVSVEKDSALDAACAILAERKFKKVPVTCKGVMVGSLSRRNIVSYMLKELK